MDIIFLISYIIYDMNKDKKIYSVLLKFKEYQLEARHMTILYMGEDDSNLDEIKKIITTYIWDNKVQSINGVFDIIDYFGPEKNIKVLRPEHNYFSILRERLDKFSKSTYTYRPHVTIDDKCKTITDVCGFTRLYFEAKMEKIVLSCNYQSLAEWELN